MNDDIRRSWEAATRWDAPRHPFPWRAVRVPNPHPPRWGLARTRRGRQDRRLRCRHPRARRVHRRAARAHGGVRADPGAGDPPWRAPRPGRFDPRAGRQAAHELVVRFTVPWVPDDPATQVSVFTTFASAQRGARWGQRQVLGAYTPEEERFVAGVAREGKYRLVKPPAGWGQ